MDWERHRVSVSLDDWRVGLEGDLDSNRFFRLEVRSSPETGTESDRPVAGSDDRF